MTKSDIESLMRGIAPAIRDYVAEQLAPLKSRIAELEKRRCRLRQIARAIGEQK